MQAVYRYNFPKVLFAAALALLISLSWLLFPYLVQGTQLLRSVGDDSRMMQGNAVSQFFTRTLINAPELELQATFASEEFFQFVDNTRVIGNVRPDRNYVFFVSENIHQGQLSIDLPEAALIVGQKRYTPNRISGPKYADHHRVTLFSFPKRDGDGDQIDLHTTDSMHLEVSNYYFDDTEKMTFLGTWLAPFELPEDLRSKTNITLVGVIALGIGLLSSVLTPCLLQLVVMFGTVIGSFSTVPNAGTDAGITGINHLTPLVRRKVMQIAMAFVISFVLLYALSGALIGAAGHQAQLMFSEFSRDISLVSGIIVIVLGLWLGLRSTRPIACRINTLGDVQGLSRADTVATVATSVGYALGCTACFGGAIVATLIVYVGAIGSPSIGAAIMFIFSLGVALPFLLSAFFLSKMDTVLEFLIAKSRAVSLVGMVLVVSLGLILATDNFHVLSDAIYPYLGLR
ncbi:cytochrome c biogenesis CcdA family protein [Kineobactrum salinum]|uniref:Cytochrome C biogenesis protein transmembrane domain-containing protein n=1 Tax=Kineobactrum salinum TaxID=2708301 RepID=A0A6C0U3P7_9GAMM|nr:cytochrome c biogenesis protein CcdA [Kineobactrum salinum]QIB64985.1 hypothetical protein G3T16_05805 [Kineobactrum salinum]